MGLINTDNFETSQGVQIANSYICITGIQAFKETDVYKMYVSYKVFVNEVSRSSKTPLDELNLLVSNINLSTNLYEQAYTELKVLYPNYVDVL